MTIQDLIDFHQRAVDGCDAYATTDDPDKQTAKHYLKRAEWHRDAVGLLSEMSEPVAYLNEHNYLSQPQLTMLGGDYSTAPVVGWVKNRAVAEHLGLTPLFRRSRGTRV